MKKLYIVALALAALASPAFAQSKLTVIAATEDLASIGREVGGDRITIESIAKGYQDPHFVEAKPSFILKLQKADVLVVVGRELEIGWLPPLIQQSRNARIQVGAEGYLDASLNAQILELPTGQITREMGDVHPSAYEAAGAYTPVPGGVGPLTIALLLKNTIAAANGRCSGSR